MLSPSLARWLFRFGLAGLVCVLLAYAALFLAIARPGLFFGHAEGNDAVTFRAEAPLPPEARMMADEVVALLAQGPLGAPDRPVNIWLVEDGLPLRLFFSGSPRASGLTYPVASLSNVFLRHADIPANRLVRDGRAVPPPRTLSYFIVHEITHLQLAAHVGRRRVVRMPRWINEGYADYVALGPASPAMIAQARAGFSLPRSLFGTYPRERVCVTLALAQLQGSNAALFALDSALPAGGGCPLVPEFGLAAGPGHLGPPL